LANLDAALQQAQLDADRADVAERQAREAELLHSWLQIREVALIAQESERELASVQEELKGFQQQAGEQARRRVAAHRTTMALTLSAALAAVAGIGLPLAGLRPALALIAAAALAGVLAWRSRGPLARAAQAQAQADQAVTDSRSELNRREGEQALAQRTGQDPTRLAAIESELASLGAAIPEDVPSAHTQLQTLPPQTEAAPSPNARQRLGELGGQRQSELSQLRQLEVSLQDEAQLLAAKSALEAEMASAEAALAEARRDLGDDAAGEAEARGLAATARAELQQAEAARAKAQLLATDLEARQQRLDTRQVELEAIWTQIIELRPEAIQDVEACRALWRETGDQLAVLDEPRLKRESAQVVQQLAASEERAHTIETRLAQIDAELAALDLSDEELAGIDRAAAYPDLAASALDQREAAVQQEQRDLLGQVRSWQDQQTTLEHELGMQGVVVNYADSERELAAFEHQLQVAKQAYRIVTLARRNIVAKVLPSTVRNMSLLLPLLTSDRYRDVDIDPETYRIKVWDESAHAMKAKDIFSGGTRDQFSLALRLAFALATLPEELGTAPGFIFLDEPLSSFDTLRTDALVDLLTRGPVADSFEQIFVISHSRSFDESLFDYHLQLDAGRILSTDLPAQPEVPDDQQVPMALAGIPSPAEVAVRAGPGEG
ncbi:MAG TPA: hypothetical protein VKU60_16195, partial [Chloroflexota bacterium]|nr:hypothetical protein [Chloroflexota bacterium]